MTFSLLTSIFSLSISPRKDLKKKARDYPLRKKIKFIATNRSHRRCRLTVAASLLPPSSCCVAEPSEDTPVSPEPQADTLLRRKHISGLSIGASHLHWQHRGTRKEGNEGRRRRTRVVAVEAEAGEATDRSRRRRLTVAAHAIVVGVRARATFPSNHLGRHLGRLAGC